MAFNKTESFPSRNCFCSDDLDDLLGDLVATFGNVDTFVLSLQNCRFIDDNVGANSLPFVSFILQVVDSNIGGDIFILILIYKVVLRKSCVVFENLVPPHFFPADLV